MSFLELCVYDFFAEHLQLFFLFSEMLIKIPYNKMCAFSSLSSGHMCDFFKRHSIEKGRRETFRSKLREFTKQIQERRHRENGPRERTFCRECSFLLPQLNYGFDKSKTSIS